MANLYTPEQVGIKPPPGGFQQGGWYQSRQYWGGTLSDPGVIHPSSNQVGAGQPVSKEVVQQTNPANWPYIQQQQVQAAAKPVTPAASVTPAPTAPAPGGVSAPGGATAGAGAIITPQPTINLPDMYKNLYATSGISDLEKQLSDKTTAYNEAQRKINDNPYLSEANRVGRIQKLTTDFNNNIANLKNDIATKKADIETQLNLQTKQFDINSQTAQQALSQLNTLLNMGALNNASGEDIANITRSTGISSSMIYSAIEANKKKDVKTNVYTETNDAGEVTAIVLNTETGEIIKKTSLGNIGKATKKTKAPKATREEEAYATTQNAIGDIQRGSLLKDLVGHYVVPGGLTVDDLYRIYNLYSPYGTANETLEEVKAGQFLQ